MKQALALATRASQLLLLVDLLIGGRPVVAGVVEIRIVDAETGDVIPARIELTDARGRHPHPAKLPFWHHEFTSDGPFDLHLSAGTYKYLIRRGPEYHEMVGSFVMQRDATDNKALELKRHITMKDRGWWSGDLWVERRSDDLSQLIVGEDLHLLVAVTTDLNSLTNAPIQVTEDRCVDRSLLALDSTTGRVHLRAPSETLHQVLLEPHDSPFQALSVLSESTEETPLQIVQPESWDTPLWLATGKVNAMVIHRPGALQPPESKGRPRNEVLFPVPDGLGRYREHIYYQALNAGLRLSPVASSGSGRSRESPGEYRTYVQLDQPMTTDAWWRGLDKGRAVITNGPLMVPLVNGELPGHVFRADAGETVVLATSLTLHTRSNQKIEYLQFLQDGKSVAEVRLDEFAKRGGQLPKIEFTSSGWLVIRAVANDPQTYRYAATAPFYVEIGYQPRISRQAVQFFLDWVVERAKLAKVDRPEVRERLLPILRNSRDFWEKRLRLANAE